MFSTEYKNIFELFSNLFYDIFNILLFRIQNLCQIFFVNKMFSLIASANLQSEFSLTERAGFCCFYYNKCNEKATEDNGKIFKIHSFNKFTIL